MRTKTLLSMAFAGLLMVLGVSAASAERVKTTQTTKVMKRPGEKEAVITRVQKGRTLTVIARQGRWMKVRVNGRTGWVARSTVQSNEAREDMPRNTRRRPFVDGRSTRRGWGGEAPEDRVGADAIEEDDDGDSDDEDRPAPRKKVKKAKKAKHREIEADDEDEDSDSDDGDADDEDSDEDSADSDDEDEEEAAPKEPAKRMVQVAVAKTKLRSKPSKKGRSVHKVKKGVSLVVLDEQKGWMLVEDPDGEQGWIKKTEISEGGRPARQIDITARLGFERMAQVFRSDGTGALAGYDIAAASAQVSLRVDYVQKYQKAYLIGVDARYDLGKSTPGIRYQTDAAAADIPYTTHDVQAAALVGYDFHHKTGAAAFARVGYHYNIFQVANVGDFTKNLAHLPSEVLAGVTVGVAGDLPKLTDKIGAHMVADYMVMGKRAQTKGLEDGAVSTAKAAWASLQVEYAWKPSMSIDIGYQYEYAKTVWTGAVAASMRGTQSTDAARKDTSHALLIGLLKTW